MNIQAGVELIIVFYFGRPYNPTQIETCLSAIKDWLQDDTVTVYSIDIPAMHVTHNAISQKSQFLSSPQNLSSQSLAFRKLLKSKFVQRVESRVSYDNFILGMSPRILDDDTAAIELSFGLRPKQETEPLRKIVSQVLGEERLFSILSHVESLWSVVGIDPDYPSIHDISKDEDTLPLDWACYGRSLVEVLGEEPLLKILKKCPKVIRFKNHQIFFSWTWESTKPLQSQAFREFSHLISTLGKKLKHLTME